MYASDQAQAQVVLGKKIRDIFEIVDIDRRRGGRGGRQDKRSRESEERQRLKRSKRRLTNPTREAQAYKTGFFVWFNLAVLQWKEGVSVRV